MVRTLFWIDFQAHRTPLYSATLALILTLLPLNTSGKAQPLAAFPDSIPEFTIAIDPGHGGAANRRRDDMWDPVSRVFLVNYRYGMVYRDIPEHEVVLTLGLKLRDEIEKLNSDEGWREFEKLLRQFSPQSDFPRIRFRVVMTRTDSYRDSSLPSDHPRINDRYRAYDFPGEDGQMQIGRYSMINSHSPYLVLSLHTNPAPRGHPGGMAAVLMPGYDTYNLLRQISLGERPASHFRRTPWHDVWLDMEPGWSKLQSARADAWVYMHGFRTVRDGSRPWMERNRGIRHNMVTWSYRDPPGWERAAARRGAGQFAIRYNEWRPEGPFWEREQSNAERWRREGGPLGFGGDNHLAADELMRFVQYGVRLQNPERNNREGVGPIHPPYVSTYGLPVFTNAIVAFLEIGFLNRTRDREILIEEREAVARSLTVGIYSLFQGVRLNKGYGPYQPRGAPLNFRKYQELPEGNHFKNSAPR